MNICIVSPLILPWTPFWIWFFSSVSYNLGSKSPKTYSNLGSTHLGVCSNLILLKLNEYIHCLATYPSLVTFLDLVFLFTKTSANARSFIKRMWLIPKSLSDFYVFGYCSKICVISSSGSKIPHFIT